MWVGIIQSNPLRTWESKKGWERGDSSCLTAWAGALISPAFRPELNNWLHLGHEPAGFQSELHIELVLLCRTLTNTSVWGDGASSASIREAYASQVTTTSLRAVYKVLPQTSSLIPTHTLGRRNSYSPMYRWGNWGPQRLWCAPGPTSFLTPISGLISTGVWPGLLPTQVWRTEVEWGSWLGSRAKTWDLEAEFCALSSGSSSAGQEVRRLGPERVH